MSIQYERVGSFEDRRAQIPNEEMVTQKGSFRFSKNEGQDAKEGTFGNRLLSSIPLSCELWFAYSPELSLRGPAHALIGHLGFEVAIRKKAHFLLRLVF